MAMVLEHTVVQIVAPKAKTHHFKLAHNVCKYVIVRVNARSKIGLDINLNVKKNVKSVQLHPKVLGLYQSEEPV